MPSASPLTEEPDTPKSEILSGLDCTSSSDPDIGWYVVNTHPHSEWRAIQNLTRQGWKCFCPVTKQTHRSGRNLITRSVPLFPSYLFVTFCLQNSQWRSIDSTYGVKKILKSRDTPARVPIGVVETLQAMTSQDGTVDFTSKLRVGEQVRFAQGPFAQMIGTLEALDNKGRVVILLNILGGRSHVKAAAKDITPFAVA